MKFIDKMTKLGIADSQSNPIEGELPSLKEIKDSFHSMILSASGWRKIFAQSNDPEDSTEGITKADCYLSAMIALSLATYLGYKEDCPLSGKTVLLGIDARPTGPAILDVMTRTLLCCGIKVKSLFIAAAPQLMAYSAVEEDSIDAFIYISASHNPVGYNGIKFGRNGGVFPGVISHQLADTFTAMVEDSQQRTKIKSLLAEQKVAEIEEVYSAIKEENLKSKEIYRNFILQTAAMGKDENKFLSTLKNKLKETKIGIIGELNGSARGASIDKDFLTEIGCKTQFLNATPRKIVHAIVPEGENLEMCRKALETAYAKDKSFILGYVPDNDGDRGNLVYIKESDGKAYILGAQTVFALVVLAVLSKTRMLNPDAHIAIAVNGPTSNRIDDIAAMLNITVARSEVGEANVVELAQKLRNDGNLVKILGEGSNGGNITYPAKVRDPMNTLMSLIDLLTNPEIFGNYRKYSSYKNPTLTIENILNSLPNYITTDAFSDKAQLKVTSDQQTLKNNFEKLFQVYFEKHKDVLMSMYDIASYKEYQMEGTQTREGMGEEMRTPPYKGGLKIAFLNDRNMQTDFIWMRGSGTEPVFRILVDSRGLDHDRHDALLLIERQLIEEADKLS